jgi:hypothetical protein
VLCAARNLGEPRDLPRSADKTRAWLACFSNPLPDIGSNCAELFCRCEGIRRATRTNSRRPMFHLPAFPPNGIRSRLDLLSLRSCRNRSAVPKISAITRPRLFRIRNKEVVQDAAFNSNRAGPNAAMSTSGFVPVITCDMTCAVIGASRIPSRKWPVATK